MKLSRLFTTLGVAATFATSLIVGLPKPKEVLAQTTSMRPYAVLVNGYNDCCVWTDPKYRHMEQVIEELEKLGVEIRKTPWDSFADGGKERNNPLGRGPSTSNDAAFLREAADYINKLDPSRPLILIGHSFGGDSLLSLAPRINRRIQFLGVIDPVAAGGLRTPIRGRGVPSNVDYFFNRWETNRLDALINPKNAVPFDSFLDGKVAECRAKVCNQDPANFARNADGSEIRVQCRWDEFTCPGFSVFPPRRGNKAERMMHNSMPYDAYIQRQFIDNIKKQLAAFTPPSIVAPLSISPTTATLQAGGTQQFTVKSESSSNTQVTWSATGGTINNNGLYTAPNTEGTYAVTATGAADPSQKASAKVTVTRQTSCVDVPKNLANIEKIVCEDIGMSKPEPALTGRKEPVLYRLQLGFACTRLQLNLFYPGPPFTADFKLYNQKGKDVSPRDPLDPWNQAGAQKSGHGRYAPGIFYLLLEGESNLKVYISDATIPGVSQSCTE